MNELPPLSEKLKADSVIHAKWLIPMTEKNLVLENHSLAIRDENILAILPTDEMKQRCVAAKTYELSKHHVVIPGLINAHGHSPMSLFRGYADDMPLNSWLEKRIWPAENKWVNESFVRDGSELAIGEMLLGGTTAFCDMYFFPDVIASSALKANIRVMLPSPILDFPTVWAQDADEYIHKATVLHDEYKNTDLVTMAFGPHAPYTVSDEPLRKISVLSSELDTPVHIHVHENQAEIDHSMKEYGVRPLQRLEQIGLMTPNLQCVHLTQLEDHEIAKLSEANATVIHCPASNLKLANGMFRGKELLENGINVCLGTDSAASNNELNMLNEMRIAALLGKGQSADAEALPAWEVLKMSTVNGARALGMDSMLGTLERGKLADIAIFNLGKLNSMPVNDPLSAIVYSTQASQCSHVWVAGKLNVNEGKLTSLDYDTLMNKAIYWQNQLNQN